MKGKRKVFDGEIVGTKMEKTVIVKVTSKVADPLYKKFVKKARKFKAHTEKKLGIGERVKIEQCRPLSKTKKWRVIGVLEDKS
jgi:small subunit ribosomal protein S17